MEFPKSISLDTEVSDKGLGIKAIEFKTELVNIPDTVSLQAWKSGIGIMLRQALKTESKASPLTEAILKDRVKKIAGKTVSWGDVVTATKAVTVITVTETPEQMLARMTPEEIAIFIQKLQAKAQPAEKSEVANG